MKKILNYITSNHFQQRMTERNIEPFLISMCLSKGRIVEKSQSKIEYTLTKEQLGKFIIPSLCTPSLYYGLERITVVARDNILVTVFTRFSDSGFNLN